MDKAKLPRVFQALAFWELCVCLSAALLLTNMTLAEGLRSSYDSTGNRITTHNQVSLYPSITGQPQTHVVRPGQPASFSIVLQDSQDVTYQWQFNGNVIPGATNDTFFLLNADGATEGPYCVVISNSFGSITSTVAQLYLDTDGDGLPDGWELAYFGSLTSQAALGDADSDGVSNLDEFRGATSPVNSASALFRLTVLNVGGGSVATSPALISYTNGSQVLLTAIPYGSNLFHGWTGADTNTLNSFITLSMNSNITIQASFALPCQDIIWDSLLNSDWDAPANWSPRLIPGSTDTATLGSSTTVTISGGAQCGGLRLGGYGNAPTLVVNGTLTLFGPSFWSEGIIVGNGATYISPSASLDITNNGIIGLYSGVLQNSGIMRWSGLGSFDLANGSILTNCPGAVWDVQNNVTFRNALNNPRIENAGTLRRSAGTGAASVNVPLNNGGSIEIQTGILVFNHSFKNEGQVSISSNAICRIVSSGSSNSGIFTNQQGGLVEWPINGNISLDPGTELRGSGLYRINSPNGSAVLVNTNVIIENLDLNGGTIAGAGIVTISNLMNWTAGNLSDAGSLVVAPGASLHVGNANAITMIGRSLDNGGTVSWTGADWAIGFATINNRASGIFELRNDSTFAFGGFLQRFDNEGVLRKIGSTGTSTFSLPLNNFGSLDLQSGVIFAKNGYFPAGSSTLRFTLSGTNNGTGYGKLQINGATTIGGALQIALTNGFNPPVNSAFTVLTADSISGAFASFSYPSNETVMQLSTSSTSVVVRVSGPYFATPSQLPDAARALGYTQQLTAVMASTPIVYSLVASSLPPGLSLSSGGLISGLANSSGNFAFTVQAMGAGTVSIQQAFSLRVQNLPPAGLISWWRAENNALDTISTNHGALLGGASFVTGKVGQAFSFDGLDDYVSIADAANLKPASITLEAWVNFAGNSGGIMCRPLGPGLSDSYELYLYNGAIGGGFTDPTFNADILSSPFTPVPGQWYHIAYTFDNDSKQQALYVNGSTVASGQSFRTIGYDNHPVILGGDIENGSPGFLFAGQIDEAAIYNRALSASEIAAIYSTGSGGKPANLPYFVTAAKLPDAAQMVGYTQQVAAVLGANPLSYSVSPGNFLPTGLTISTAGLITGIPTAKGTNTFSLRATDSIGGFSDQIFTLEIIQPVPVPPGLVSWWRGEGNALDSASTNHGTATNGVLYFAGKVGLAFILNNATDFVNIPDAPSLRPGSVTLEAWAMFNGPFGPVFCKPLNSGTGDSMALYYAGGGLNGFIHDATENGVLASIPFTPIPGQWYHVAFSFDDVTKEQALYLNGVRVASSQSFRSIGYDPHPLLLGQDINNGTLDFPLSGAIDEAAIYNRALTTNEIAGIYKAGVAGKRILNPLEQWKLTYLGDFYAPDTGDPDGDGRSNFSEYVADTNPTNSASALQITRVVPLPAGIAIEWHGGIQATQYLERASGLASSDLWSAIFTNTPPTDSVASFTNFTGLGAAEFYRVRVAR